MEVGNNDFNDGPGRRGPAGDDENEWPESAQQRLKTLSAQKNINRGKYLEEKELREAAEARLAELEKARNKGENAGGDTDIDAEIAELDRKAREALEQTELEDYDKFKTEAFEKRLQKSRREEQGSDDNANDGGDGQPGAKKPVAEALTQEWVNKNAEWFAQDGSKHDPDKRKAAIEIEKDLRENEGFMPNDPEMFEELNNRLEKRFSKGNNDDDGGRDEDDGDNASFDDADLGDEGIFAGDLPDMPDEAPASRTNQQPVSGSQQGDDNSGRERQGGSRRLTEADKASMRITGLNPGNPTDRANFLKYRRSL